MKTGFLLILATLGVTMACGGDDGESGAEVADLMSVENLAALAESKPAGQCESSWASINPSLKPKKPS